MLAFIDPSQMKPADMTSVGEKVGHIGHFRWLGPNVWWEISQIYVEYIKPVRQMCDEPCKFFAYTDMTPIPHTDISVFLVSSWPQISMNLLRTT